MNRIARDDTVAMVPKKCSFTVAGSMNGVPTTDTGAAVTLLCKDVWDKLLLEPSSLQPYTGSPLVGVTGEPLEVWGSTVVDIDIAGEQFHTQVVVTSALTAEAILGGDFLREHGCTLEIGTGVLRFVNRGVAIALNDSSTDPVIVQARVTLGETVRIPAFSEKEVVARIDKPLREGVWLLEGDNSGRLPVSIANALVNTTSPCVPMRILNNQPESVVLFKGTKVGTVEQAPEKPPLACTPVELTTQSRSDVSKEQQQTLWRMTEECGDAGELTNEQKEQFYMLLLENADLFAEDGWLGRTDLVKHHVDTGSSPPIRQPVRRIPPYKREEARHLLQDMLSKNVIRPSSNPWASPIVLVPKKDGGIRFCIDYRKVNSVTRRDAYPLPRVDDTLDTLAGARWFSTLDMLSGYWQVELAEEDKEKTAFCTSEGLFEFNVLPFGLCNGPATYQRLMDLVLTGLQWSSCLVYLDDVIVMGLSFQEHLQNLDNVFQRLRNGGSHQNVHSGRKRCYIWDTWYLGKGFLLTLQKLTKLQTGQYLPVPEKCSSF